MKVNRAALALLSTSLLQACATAYQPTSLSGGYSSKQIEGDVHRVTFSANGYSSVETAQTYWLYRCADLALEKGYQGFEILSNINLVLPISPDQFFAPAPLFRQSQYYVPIIIDNSNKPLIQADIRLLYAPIAEAPPKVFDATKLKVALDPYVNGKKCSTGNVCEHVHKYLFPDGKFQ